MLQFWGFASRCARCARLVGLGLGAILFVVAPTLGDVINPDASASLSGYVYVDTNGNNVMDSADLGIPGATVSITRIGDSNPLATITSGADGSYYFGGLPAGTYSLAMVTPSTVAGQDAGTFRSILANNGNTLVSQQSSGTVTPNAVGGIALANGQMGTNFNFAETAFPVALVSKRMFLNTSLTLTSANDIAPVLATDPTSSATVSFNPVLVTKSGTGTVTAQNVGGNGSTLWGTFPTASGAFSLTGASAIGPLSSGQQASGSYTYTPTTRGLDTQPITITSNGGNSSLTLSCLAVAPVASVTAQTDAGYVLVGNSKAGAITVQNTGDGNKSGPGDISNLQGSLSNISGMFSLTGGNVNLSDGAQQTFNYTYTPTTRGTKDTASTTAAFTNGNPSGDNTAYNNVVSLTGQGVAPLASVTAQNAGFVLVGSSQTASVTVYNTGDGNKSGLGDASNLKGSLSAVSGGIFSLTGGSVNLPDNSQQTFNYTYTASTRGAESANTTATFTNGNASGDNSSYITNVSLSGIGVAPLASVTAYSAGNVLVGSSKTGNITVQNNGDGNLSGLGEISNLKGSLSGVASGAFSLTNSPFSLLDGAQQTFAYSFAPTVRGGTGTTTTAVFTNGNPTGNNSAYTGTVSLSGMGVAPVQVVDASAAQAGLVRIGTTGSAGITIKNVGDGNKSGLGSLSNLIGAAAAASGTFGGSGGAISLQDNTSQTLQFAYTPLSHASNTSPIAIQFANGSSDGTNQAQTVTATLSGQGVGPVYQSVAAPGSTLDYGAVHTGSSTPLFLSISNASTDPNGGNSALTDLTLLDISLTGQDNALFKIIGFTPGTQLHEGDSLNVEIDYTGNGPLGSKLAWLDVVTDEGAALGANGHAFNYKIIASVVPEPSSIMLLVTAGLSATWILRRRRASV
jgi:hypothetical protein